MFDGSAKSSSGVSLNEVLLPGPVLLKNLFAICQRFRRHQFVFSADIEKMFRQIWLHHDDCDFQRIVWRETPEDPIQHFSLKTVTYGTATAPFLAQRTLHQLAADYLDKFPLASSVLLNDFYVDDVMTGCNNVDELISLKDQLLEL